MVGRVEGVVGIAGMVAVSGERGRMWGESH